MQQSMELAHGERSILFEWYAEQFSRPLFVHNYSDPKSLTDVVKKLCFRSKIQPRESTVNGLEKLILDMFVRSETSEGFSSLGVFTSNGAITGKESQQYKHLGFVGKALRGYLNKLERNGYVEVFPGCPGHSTKIRATKPLIDELKSAGICLENIRYRRINPAVYTNDFGENICIDPEHAERVGSDIIDRYNELLRHSQICVGDLHLLPHEKQVRRIFKDKEATTDGRHYGAVWQVLPSKARGRITINGLCVTECDIRSTHPLIAYALQRMDLTELRLKGFDPYKLDKLDNTEDTRAIIKLTVLMMFNCVCKPEAISAAQGKINKSPELYKTWKKLSDKRVNIEDIVDWITLNNESIRKYFFTGSWDLFNFYESNIAQRVIEHFTNKGIPILTVYDSFIVQQEYKEELQSKITASIAIELMMIFRRPDDLINWSSDRNITDQEAAIELIKARTYKDRFNN